MRGCRNTGDVNTSGGNTLVNILAHLVVFRTLKLRLGLDVALLLNSDDTVLVTNKPIDVSLYQQTLLSMGLKPKIRARSHVSQLTFLNALFVPMELHSKPVWLLTPKPFRVMSRISIMATPISLQGVMGMYLGLVPAFKMFRWLVGFCLSK
jgi:hypothetical protein